MAGGEGRYLQMLKNLCENLFKIGAFLKVKLSWNRKDSPNQKTSNKGVRGSVNQPQISGNNNVVQSGTENIVQNFNGHSTTVNNYLSQVRDCSSVDRPDLALRFVYPESPALVIVNQSSVLAKDIKWAVALWNMDLPDRNDPLPIPVSMFDWIRPNDEGGPQNFFGEPLVASLLKRGDRLFGSASVCSPESIRGRSYIVYIVYGKGGWVSEVEDEKSGKLLIPPNFLKSTRAEYFKALEARIALASRIPIGSR